MVCHPFFIVTGALGGSIKLSTQYDSKEGNMAEFSGFGVVDKDGNLWDVDLYNKENAKDRAYRDWETYCEIGRAHV